MNPDSSHRAIATQPAEPPPQPVPPVGPDPAPPTGPQPFPRPVERRLLSARSASVLLLLASSLGLAGCPVDKVPNPKASEASVPR